jgi:hypothetical protein
LPVWSADERHLYFLRQEQLDRHELPRTGSDIADLILRDHESSLWRVNAEGEEPTQLVRRKAFGFGWVAIAPDERFLIFSEVENPTRIWEHRLAGDTYDDELLARYGPQVRILRLDLETGKLKTLVRNAGRPKVQPMRTGGSTSASAAPISIVAAPQVSDLTPTSATITWNTDRPATGIVEYGLTSDLGRTRPRIPGEATTNHRVELDNLSPGTAYYYRVRNTNAGGAAVSGIDTFTSQASGEL